MINEDCSSSLIFGIVCQLARGSVLSTVPKDEDPSSLKMKTDHVGVKKS